MILHPGHGITVVPDGAEESFSVRTMPVSLVCGFGAGCKPADATRFGVFDYLFPDAATVQHSSETTEHLDALAQAMVQQAPDEDQNSSIAPVFTYFGQFIDHDIAANMDREPGLSIIDTPEIVPVPRADVAAGLSNLRAGALNLDSLHGGGLQQGEIARKFDQALRCPTNRAKLWAGTVAPSDFDPIPIPTDPKDKARDILRMDRFLEDDDQVLTLDFFKSLPPDLRKLYIHPDGTPRRQRAIIGDLRNDENLAISQFHLAMVRLHNRFIDHAPKHGDAPLGDENALFDWGRRMLSWHYQWLVVNAYLPAICNPSTLEQVLETGAPSYTRFFARHGAQPDGRMPMPLEFSAATFRFAHSMVRDAYDWNRLFGSPRGQPLTDEASFRQLFAFTGNGEHPMAAPVDMNTFGPSAPRLPQHWPIEWARFVHPPTPDTPRRSARKIDTKIAVNLGQMANEEPGASGMMAQLAARNLRRGHKLNLPSAQACLAALAEEDGITLSQLSPAEISRGEMRETIIKAGFDQATPLWFYVLKEAEVLGKDGRLGPLGSWLVADTLLGLVIQDPASYWHATPRKGAWHPRDGVRPDGIVIDSMARMMDAARIL